MVKTSSIKKIINANSVKAFLPVLLGFSFIFFFLYILYNYDSHERINSYTSAIESRNALLERYNMRYEHLKSETLQIDNDNPQSHNLSLLESSRNINEELLAISRSILEITHALMAEKNAENLVLLQAYEKADNLRVELHISLDEYLEGQYRIAQYLEKKDNSEKCFQQIDLSSVDYTRQVGVLDKCLSFLSGESDFVSTLSEDFLITGRYLVEYNRYWTLIRDMHTSLVNKDTNEAKRISEEAKKVLLLVNSLSLESENELNSNLIEKPLERVESVTEELNKKIEEITFIEESI